MKWIRRSLKIILGLFILMNVMAWFHASKFTHFDRSGKVKTKADADVSLALKIKAVFFGVSNPRPAGHDTPSRAYETIILKSNKEIECWHIKVNNSIGTVILFHGYGGEKSSMLDKSEVFNELGYNTFLVDFMGSGGSEGDQTTIGFYEAEEVKTAFNYLEQSGEKNSVLFGTSMGAVAIMKALNDYQLPAESVILECPFGTMLKTVKARFSLFNIPSFPMAQLLVFWGGLQNGFNAFEHNPVNYACNINCPVLLVYGQQDLKVSQTEINEIYANLKGRKMLKQFPLAGHENYLNKYRKEWCLAITAFLKS